MFVTVKRPYIQRRKPVFVSNHFGATVHQRPAVNVLEKDDAFVIELAAPGLNKADFNIKVENDVLTIAAKKEVTPKEGEKYTRKEFNYTQFTRTFQLPETVDTTQITAAFENGILTLNLAKKEEAKVQPARAIAIG